MSDCTRKEVVDRDYVHALAGNGIEVGRAGGDQGLALAGFHLGNVAQVQSGTAHELDIEMAHAQGPVGGFAHRGKCLGQQGIERSPVLVALLELVRLGTQLGIGKTPEFIFQDVDRVGVSPQFLQRLLVAGPQDTFKH